MHVHSPHMHGLSAIHAWFHGDKLSDVCPHNLQGVPVPMYINNDLTVNNFLQEINYHHLTLYFVVRLLAVVILLLLLNCSTIHQKQW